MAKTAPLAATTDVQGEEARLAALVSSGILDSEPEPVYDAITRLAAEYFHADTVLLGFADASRIWIKSSGASRSASCRAPVPSLTWSLPTTVRS
jgi:hypothetical protein